MRGWRLCARLVVVFCLVAFGLGDAVERGFAGHSGLDSALSHAASTDQSAGVSADHSGTHVDGDTDGDMGGQLISHGCHGCAALPQPFLKASAAPIALGASLSWASVPSAAGHEPLVDLPPPRA